MGFLKDLGGFAGELTGAILGGSVRVVGEITGSKFIKEIGDGVESATKFAGQSVGNLASGTWDVVAGVVTQDNQQFENGFVDIGSTVSTTAKGVGNALCNVVDNGATVVKGFQENNDELIKQGAKGIVYAAAVSAIAVGIVDVLDVDSTAHAAELDDSSLHASAETTELNVPEVNNEEVTLVENPNEHHVAPHYVEGYDRADGTHVEGYYRDGDGDTSVNNPNGGWNQSNPDFRVKE